MIIEPKFRGCGPFSPEGYAPIYVPGNNTHYFIDVKGKRMETSVRSFSHDNVITPNSREGFVAGFAMVKVNGLWGYMNSSLNMAVPATFNRATYFDKGIGIGKKARSVYVIHSDGRETIIPFEGLTDGKPFSEGFSAVRIDGLYGFVNSNAELKIEPKYKVVGPFSNGLAVASIKGDSVGFINTNGEWVIEPIYDKAHDFSEGFARAKKGPKWILIDTKGNEFLVDLATKFGDFHDDLCYARNGALAGFLNKELAWAIKPQFEEVRDFSYGLAPAKVDGLWGFIDKTGKMVIEAKYAAVKSFTGSSK